MGLEINLVVHEVEVVILGVKRELVTAWVDAVTFSEACRRLSRRPPVCIDLIIAIHLIIRWVMTR